MGETARTVGRAGSRGHHCRWFNLQYAACLCIYTCRRLIDLFVCFVYTCRRLIDLFVCFVYTCRRLIDLCLIAGGSTFDAAWFWSAKELSAKNLQDFVELYIVPGKPTATKDALVGHTATCRNYLISGTFLRDWLCSQVGVISAGRMVGTYRTWMALQEHTTVRINTADCD